ncbi:hypothetical protein N9C85_01635 [Synechococcus sp. AH-224-I15]|nr:hypothetical protein [Synechococcus sp. AH-224-I15]
MGFQFRRYDRSSTNEEIERRKKLYQSATYAWWCKARNQEHPGLPPACSKWMRVRFEVFMRDLGRDPFEAIDNNLEFEVAPDATELSSLTVRVARSTPVRRRTTTRRTLGILQAKQAITFGVVIPEPEVRAHKGHFGRQRAKDTLRPVVRHGIAGSSTVLVPAELDPRYVNPTHGKQAFTLHEWRTEIIPRLINLIDALGQYVKPTGKIKNGLPLSQGWVPFTSALNGYGRPPQFSNAQWKAWKAYLTQLFVAPTPSPNALFGGQVPEADMPFIFAGKQLEQRMPLLRSVKGSDARVYKLGQFRHDQLWTVTKASDAHEARIHLSLLGDLAELTHAMRWQLIQHLEAAPVCMTTDPEEGRLKPEQLPPTMRYEEQLAYLASPDGDFGGPAYHPTDNDEEAGVGWRGNGENFAAFPRLFGFPDPADPKVLELNAKRSTLYREWWKARTKGQRLWPPALKDAEDLGLVERTSSGAIRWVYLPMKEKGLTIYTQRVHNPSRPRGFNWVLKPSLHIDRNRFLEPEVAVALQLIKVWRMFLERRRGRRSNKFLINPLGEDYFHPVTLQAYEVLVQNVCVQRNPHDPETGMPARPNQKQRAYLQHKEENEAELERIRKEAGVSKEGVPPEWSRVYHPLSEFARGREWLRAREIMLEEDLELDRSRRTG